jgi:hypothetical protein
MDQDQTKRCFLGRRSSGNIGVVIAKAVFHLGRQQHS